MGQNVNYPFGCLAQLSDINRKKRSFYNVPKLASPNLLLHISKAFPKRTRPYFYSIFGEGKKINASNAFHTYKGLLITVLNFEFYYQLRTKYYKGNLRWRFGVLRFIMKKIRG
ncbi:hypothetical protein DP119_03475 [Planococcus maitriensis]|uniref:Uncharacterized protein n=1 Tax=Planococcus maitriensis TaxID=221799 RepID=A0A365KBM6_9BACL|nr:hypothetical protein DP119_03475 [Planococcus maitriensis]